jgi:hypothetical protein
VNLVHQIKNFVNSRYRSLFFPIAVILGVILLTSLRLSGSSLALYETSSGESASSAGVVFGEPRPVRSDEWLVRAPWFLNQLKNGLPTVSESGIGSHDLGVSGDLPVKSLDLLIKPHQLSSLFLEPSSALAAEWWIWHALMLLGMYALVLVLTKNIGVSFLVSVLLVASPSTQWWVASGTFTTIGYGAFSAACLLKSFECQSQKIRAVLIAIAGWLSACFICTLYVPWIITTSIVLGFICSSSIAFRLIYAKQKRRELFLTLGSLGVFLAVSALFVGIFVLNHRQAITVMNSTVYPGSRTSETGGGLKMATIFGSPLDYYSWQPQTAVINGTNQSENSSGILYILPIAVLIIGFGFIRERFWRARQSVEVGATLVAGGVLLSWALIPIPSVVGKLFLLDRVPPERVLPALTFASLIALGQYLAMKLSVDTWRESSVVASAMLSFLGVSFIAASKYEVNNVELNFLNAIVLIALLSIPMFMSFFKMRTIGMIGLVAFSLLQFFNINPLQRGVAPLLENPVARKVSTIAKDFSKGDGWLLVQGDIYVRGSIEAAGVSLVSGVSRYPDYEAWKVLDPDLKYEDAWNRYGHIFVSTGEEGSDPVISSPQGDVIQVVLDPCDARLSELNVRVLVTQNLEISRCGKLIERVKWGDRTIRFYSLK